MCHLSVDRLGILNIILNWQLIPYKIIADPDTGGTDLQIEQADGKSATVVKNSVTLLT